MQGVEHPAGDLLAALGGVHRDLPDEERLGRGGTEVPEHEAHALPVPHCEAGGGREVAGQQEVGVGGVQIERAAVAGQAPHGGAVGQGRRPDLKAGAVSLGLIGG